MVQRVRDVMTPGPISVPEESTLSQVAEIMRDRDIGNVVVRAGTSVVGILTDRDMVVRGMARGGSVETMTAGELCTRDLETVAADDSAAAAVQTMRDRAIRRLPVLDDGQLVGILSIGDLAVERDPESALADISHAPANN